MEPNMEITDADIGRTGEMSAVESRMMMAFKVMLREHKDELEQSMDIKLSEYKTSITSAVESEINHYLTPLIGPITPGGPSIMSRLDQIDKKLATIDPEKTTKKLEKLKDEVEARVSKMERSVSVITSTSTSQADIIKDMEPKVDVNQGAIAALTTKITTLETKISDLEDLKKMEDTLEKTRLIADANEQYRRNLTLNITGIPRADQNLVGVLDILNNVCEANLAISDVDYLYDASKKKTTGDTLTKITFTSMDARDRAYKGRTKLQFYKKNKIWVNEDLTKIRSQINARLRALFKHKKVARNWTAHGTPFFKTEDTTDCKAEKVLTVKRADELLASAGIEFK